MFILSKVLTYILLPPGCILIAFAIGIILLIAKKKKTSILVLSLTVATFFFLCFDPFADFLVKPLEDAYAPLPPVETLDPKDYSEYSLVVVLGGGSADRSPEAGSRTVLINSGLKRAEYGAALAKKLDLPLLYSAGIVYKQEGVEPESEAARKYWLSIGIDKSRILVENASRNTHENAKFTGQIAKGKKILLVTSAFHMPRSVQSFKKQGVAHRPAPTDYQASRVPYIWVNYLPSIGALQKSYHALHERLGMVYYAWL